MTCEDLVELVTAYLEGGLDHADRAAFEEHVALCRGCATYVDQLRTTIGLLGELPADAISGRARDRLLEAFASWSGR
jgi:anti-sigma factor RsiW